MTKLLDLFKRTKEEWNLPVWDTHCHILPGVDDGSTDIETSLKMLEMSISEGIQNIILTPHYIAGQTNADLIQLQFEKLQYEVQKNGLEVQLFLGNELYYSPGILDALKKGQALTIADTSYVLIEFQTDISFEKMRQAFHELFMNGYRPILAHLERFHCLREQPHRVEQLIDAGIYMQANTNSFLREDDFKLLIPFVKKGWIHFLGTDSHRADWRPPQMRKTIQVLQKHLEKEELMDLLISNTEKMIRNQYI